MQTVKVYYVRDMMDGTSLASDGQWHYSTTCPPGVQLMAYVSTAFARAAISGLPSHRRIDAKVREATLVLGWPDHTTEGATL